MPVTIACLVGIAALATCACAPRSEAPAPAASPGDRVATAAREQGSPPARRAVLRAGETLDGLLGRLGLEPGRRSSIAAALAGHLDLRRLRPGAGVAIAAEPGGPQGRVAFRTEPLGYLRLHEQDGGWSVRRVEVPIRVGVEIGGGVIRDSLYQALEGLGRGNELAFSVAEVFQWDIDLMVDPRPGDHVRVVYEVLRLGEPPSDLPPLGDLPLAAGASLGVGRVLAASYQGKVARTDAFWIPGDSDGNAGDYYDASGDPLRKAFLRSPLNYRRISSRFSHARRNPVTRRVVPHHGVDFAAPTGTPVVATADGRVVAAGWRGALGRCIEIRHPNGFRTIYGHLSRIARGIRRGSRVTQGQVIGRVGATGRATGPHLHYAMKSDGRAVNPLAFRNPPIEPLAPEREPALRVATARWQPVLEGIRLDAGTSG